MTTVAILTPMPSEFAPLAKRVALARGHDGLYRGRIGDVDVVATITGIGTKLAHEATERVLADGEAHHVVVSGIAGGLEPFAAVGDLIVPTHAHHAATGVMYESSVIGDHVANGCVSTSDELITDPTRFDALKAQGVVALDMETAAVAAVCAERNVPWCAFRGISDVAGDGGLDDDVLALLDSTGAIKRGPALRYFLRHPGRIPTMMKLGRGATGAASAAAAAAVAAIAAHDFA